MNLIYVIGSGMKLKFMRMKSAMLLILLFLFTYCSSEEKDGGASPSYTYKVVDTGVETWYDNDSEMAEPGLNDPFFGQDAGYRMNQPDYTDNGDGTVTDKVTGLIWQQDMGEKISWGPHPV